MANTKRAVGMVVLTASLLITGFHPATAHDDSKPSQPNEATAMLGGVRLNAGEFGLLAYGIGFRSGFNEGSMMVTKIFANMHREAADDELLKECLEHLEDSTKQTISEFEKTKQGESFAREFAECFREGILNGTKIGISYGRELFAKVSKAAQLGQATELPNMNAEAAAKTEQAIFDRAKSNGMTREQAASIVEKLPTK